MKRRATLKATYPIEAALAWTTLGLQWMEMMAASGQVIARRTSRSHTPAQWFAMGTEKMEAGLLASTAMAREIARSRPLDPMAAWLRLMSAAVAPYHSRATRNARR